jgi:hypothetical protein|nr:hypothetical protein [uncultured Flavobacterium sp.]
MLFPYFKDKKINHIVSKEARKFRNKYAQTVLDIKKTIRRDEWFLYFSPDSSDISRFRKTRLFSRSFYLSGIQRRAGLAPETETSSV